MNITPQQLFDNAAYGIASQGHRAAVCDDGTCVALTPDGRRCALGWSVTDATAGDVFTLQWDELSKTSLGFHLANAHDYDLRRNGGKDAWLRRMAEIALEYGLDDSALWMEVKP